MSALMVVILAVGCGDSGSRQSASDGQDRTGGARSTSGSDARIPSPGEPGSIQGVVKSPYITSPFVAVFVVRVDGRKFELPEKNPVMEQKNRMFVPRVLPILAGTTVDLLNSDTVRHNVGSYRGSVQQFNIGVYDVGVAKHQTFDQVGVVPLECTVHSDERAFIVVCQNPYFAVTDKEGSFAIPNVPPGEWRLQLFHEQLKEKTIEVEVKPGEETSVEFTDLEKK